MAKRRYNVHRDPRLINEGYYRACVESVRVAIIHNFKLSRPTQFVGLHICDMMVAADSLKRRYAYPSIPTIAAKIGCSESTVDRAIAALKEAGYFFIKRGNKRDRQANRYWPLWQGKPAPTVPPSLAARYVPHSQWAKTAADYRRWITDNYDGVEELPGWDAAPDSRILAFVGAVQDDHNHKRRIDLGAIWREVERFLTGK